MACICWCSHRARYGRDDFSDQGKLVRALSRERGKDMASDYGPAPEQAPEPNRDIPSSPPRNPFAGLRLQASMPEALARGMFEGLKLSVANEAASSIDPSRDVSAAVRRYAAAYTEIDAAERDGRSALPHQEAALAKAKTALNQIVPAGAQDLDAALERDPELVTQARQGRTGAAIQAIALEREIRTDPAARADRFVDDWNMLSTRREGLRRAFNFAGERHTAQHMGAMAKGLERDPQVESLLRQRSHQLGLGMGQHESLSHELQRDLGLSLGRGITF